MSKGIVSVKKKELLKLKEGNKYLPLKNKKMDVFRIPEKVVF